MATKNECAKTRKANDPYEVWIAKGTGWVWSVLKKYQGPEAEAKNPYARWFCFVTSPMCPEGELGDVYCKDVTQYATRIR